MIPFKLASIVYTYILHHEQSFPPFFYIVDLKSWYIYMCNFYLLFYEGAGRADLRYPDVISYCKILCSKFGDLPLWFFGWQILTIQIQQFTLLRMMQYGWLKYTVLKMLKMFTKQHLGQKLHMAYKLSYCFCNFQGADQPPYTVKYYASFSSLPYLPSSVV